MQKIKYYALFLLIAQIIDVVLGTVFTYDVMLKNISIIFPCFFIASLLIARKFNLIESLLILTVCGFIAGIRSFQIPYIGVVCTLVSGLLAIFWFKNISDALFSSICILTASLFIKECLLFMIMKQFYYESLTFINVLTVRIVPTILVSIPISFVLLVFEDTLDYKIEKMEKMIRSNENLFFTNFNARAKK